MGTITLTKLYAKRAQKLTRDEADAIKNKIISMQKRVLWAALVTLVLMIIGLYTTISLK